MISQPGTAGESGPGATAERKQKVSDLLEQRSQNYLMTPYHYASMLLDPRLALQMRQQRAEEVGPTLGHLRPLWQDAKTKAED